MLIFEFPDRLNKLSGYPLGDAPTRHDECDAFCVLKEGVGRKREKERDANWDVCIFVSFEIYLCPQSNAALNLHSGLIKKPPRKYTRIKCVLAL